MRGGAINALISFVRLTLGLTVLAVAAPITIAILLPLLPWRALRIKVSNVYGKVVGRTIVWVVGVTPRIAHRERLDGSMPAIYIANHTSTLDLFLGIWMCPIGGCGIMKQEMVRVPFFGQVYLLSGHLRLDRTNRERAIESLREMAALVRKHRLGVFMMPEGTRSRDGRLQPFKKGFVHLAIASGIPVVPIVIHGAHRAWRTGSWRFHPSVLDIEVLPPIDTSGWREETTDAHVASVQAIFEEKLAPDQRSLPAA